eukprot:TRINITY_DN47038_c0_g1_i1.p1 TRINITY_DN47038_c0_g1~~TRINITY_DN47038_c0_g1_i1.p1  ORF type:complete len:261 (+),score=18.07 TRINITY_DN47038_c0_g1_i1:149-931(+)
MENTVAKKLEALTKLQKIDSQLDEIKKVRGDLPEEVQDLEDEIVGYETRIKKYEGDIETIEKDINAKEVAIKDARELIKKYEAQQMDVRNNREYDALSKEIESQDLDSQLYEKRIKEARITIENKKDQINETNELLSDRKKDLDNKKDELTEIIAETEVEEEKMLKQREKACKALDERLLHSYTKLRSNANNGLAVVSVQRHACGGCFNMVPPQRQADIREKKKLIVCEHCGRVLVDVEEVLEVEKPKRRTTRRKKVAEK